MKTEASKEHAELERILFAGRRAGTLSPAADDMLCDGMCDLFFKMTMEEQDEAEERALKFISAEK